MLTLQTQKALESDTDKVPLFVTIISGGISRVMANQNMSQNLCQCANEDLMQN